MGAYQQVSERLIERGYGPVPIIPGTKRPGFYCSGMWLGLANLERKVARGGHDTIDHPNGAHDDIANAAAGAAFLAMSYNGYLYDDRFLGWQDNPAEPEAVAALVRRQEQEKYHRELMQKFGQPVAMLRQ